MTTTIARIDRTFAIALAVSIAFHAALFVALTLVSVPSPVMATSVLNVRLNTAFRPMPEPEAEAPVEPAQPTSLPRLASPASPPLDTTEPDPPQLSNLPSEPTNVVPAIQVDATSLQAFVNANTNFRADAIGSGYSVTDQYRQRWHQRVQRIGQLNYPASASRLKLSGQLTLNVEINTDGSLATVGVSQSSGHDELDLAALEIVRQSSPYEPLPPNLPRNDGRYRFSSTWEFRR